MKRQKPIRELKGKKITTGTWKKRRIDYVTGEIIVGIRREKLELVQVTEQKDEIKRELLEHLPKGSKIIGDFNAQGKL